MTAAPNAPTITSWLPGHYSTKQQFARFQFSTDPGNSTECLAGLCSATGGTCPGDASSLTFSTCAESYLHYGASDDTYCFRVRATNTAGNKGPAACQQWVVDNIIPSQAPTITTPIGATAGVVDWVKVNKPPMSGAGVASDASEIRIFIDGTYCGPASLTRPNWSFPAASNTCSLGEGEHVVVAQARDAATNTRDSASVTFKVDTIAPAKPVVTKLGGDYLSSPMVVGPRRRPSRGRPSPAPTS